MTRLKELLEERLAQIDAVTECEQQLSQIDDKIELIDRRIKACLYTPEGYNDFLTVNYDKLYAKEIYDKL